MINRIGLAALLLGLAGMTQFDGAARAGGRPQRVRDLITREIEEHRRVVLRGNTRPEVRPVHDRGRVPDDFPVEHMLLQLRRPPELQKEFEEYVESLSQGNSPNFHQWLSPTEVGDRYGLSDRDLHHIERWLRLHGFRVNFVYPNRVVMDISARARELREAMHVEIHYLDVRGEMHFANVNDPEIPDALAPAVVGIVAIHNFRPHALMMERVQPAYNDPSGNHDVTPADLAAIYNLNPVYNAGITGAGQTVVVVEPSDPYTTADWNSFVQEFKLSAYGGSVTVTHPNLAGNCTDPGATAVDGEVALDMEYATAAAPGAAIEVAACADNIANGSSGVFIAFENLVQANPHPYIISVSYAECEAALGEAANTAIASMYQMAASEGISVFVAAGDWGPATCDAQSPPAPTVTHGIGVNGLASTPYNVSVGGTDFNDFYSGTTATYWSMSNSAFQQSAVGYIPEIPWNDSCASVPLMNYVGVNPPADPTKYCNGLCGSFRQVIGGGGGPSGCATGSPATANVVSGTCAGYAKPAWQSGLFGNPNDGVRDLPDVSLFASNGFLGHSYIFCNSDPSGGHPCTGTPNAAPGGPWSAAGGTSFAAPILAGIQALVNQRTHALTRSPTPGQGNPNPIYYAIAKSEYGVAGSALCSSSNQPVPPLPRGLETTCVFYDVTLGDIDLNCNSGTPNCFAPEGGASQGVLTTGSISSMGISNPGAGYTSVPSCTISAPHNAGAYNGYAGPTQATCTATLFGGGVNFVNLTNLGLGYAPDPVCTLTGGGGAGATCAVYSVSSSDYEPAFHSAPGWDFATGIGTINVRNLVFNSMWQTGT